MRLNSVSPDIRRALFPQVCGAIGPVASMGRPGPSVSDQEMGIGNTNAWKLNMIDNTTSVAFFYEVLQSLLLLLLWKPLPFAGLGPR